MKPTPVHILIVDDEPAGLMALGAVLEDLGENLVRVSSGEEALKKVLTTDFAAILLDVRMPTMSGFETARIIRSRPRSSRTPILFLTAVSDGEFAIEEAYALGAVDYLLKPVTAVVLRAKVAFFVELHRKTQELAQAERARHLAELHAKDERLRLILDNTQYYAFVMIDLDGAITEWEGGAQSITGWKKAEAIGQPLSMMFTSEDNAAGQPTIERVRARDTGRALDKRWHLRKDGSRFFADGVMVPLNDETGRFRGFAKIFRDATEVQAVNDLAASQRAALELAVAGAPLPEVLAVLVRAAEAHAGGTLRAAVLLIDDDGQHLRHGAAPSLPEAFNRAIDGIALGPSAMFGDPAAAATDIQAAPAWAKLRPLARAAGLRACWSSPICSADGKIFGTFVFYYREVRNPTAGEREAMALLANTTALLLDRHHESRERKEAEERLRLATEAAELAVWVWNAESDHVTWENDRLYDMIQLPRTEVPINAARFLADFIYPDDASAFQAALTATVLTGVRFYFQGRFRRTDGELRWIEFTGRRRPAVEGSPLCVLGTAADITDQKRAETDLRRLAADLSEANRRKTEFLATLAHELRNPLAPIRNGLEVMQLAADNPRLVARARDVMDRQLTHMVHLVNDLLDIARITSGKVELKKARVDLQSIVASAVETSLPLIEAGHHQLIQCLPETPLPVDVDPTRLAQVVSNLLNNAAKYTPNAGRIELLARRDGGEVVVEISDTGVGIPADSLPWVFEMFNQVGRNRHRAQGGLGIGLTLVRRLVELHGGTVQALSAGAGQGSTFVVRLPLAGPEERPDLQARPNAVAPAVSARKLRVLVVDDNQDGAESLAELLQLSGHTTQVANDGHRALALAPEFLPEVIFLDIGMPDMNGYEVARAIRQNAALPHIVLVALTGWGAETDRARSKEAGFDEHLIKPAELTAVRALLDKIALASS